MLCKNRAGVVACLIEEVDEAGTIQQMVYAQRDGELPRPEHHRRPTRGKGQAAPGANLAAEASSAWEEKVAWPPARPGVAGLAEGGSDEQSPSVSSPSSGEHRCSSAIA